MKQFKKTCKYIFSNFIFFYLILFFLRDKNYEDMGQRLWESFVTSVVIILLNLFWSLLIREKIRFPKNITYKLSLHEAEEKCKLAIKQMLKGKVVVHKSNYIVGMTPFSLKNYGREKFVFRLREIEKNLTSIKVEYYPKMFIAFLGQREDIENVTKLLDFFDEGELQNQ